MAYGSAIERNVEADVSRDVSWHSSQVGAADRARLLCQDSVTVWLTGLSGAGKSTIAFELERRLVGDGHLAFVLDGDNVRHGLSRDLGFSHEDRSENIRRIAEVARLFNDAGVIVIAAFISPYREDREMARKIVGADRFIETHLCASIEICEARDTKGLYGQARAGRIADFTGVSAPYEAPVRPELAIDTGCLSIEESAARILGALAPRLF